MTDSLVSPEDELDRLRIYRDDHERELRLARQMQASLLPSSETLADLRRETGFVVEALFRPWAELGGDWWTVQSLGSGRFAVVFFDFSGHGLASAINTFRLHAVMQGGNCDPRDPAVYLADLNHQLLSLLPAFQFATCFIAVIDSAAGLMTYAAAGAPSPLLMGKDRDAVFLDGSGLPLGISRNAAYTNCRIAFPRGTALLLYSDALIETPDKDGRCLDPDALVTLALTSRSRAGRETPLDDFVDGFLSSHGPLTDDLTLVWLTGPLSPSGV